MENEEYYDVDLQPVILYIPNNTVKLNINAKIIDDNEKFVEVGTTMTLPEIIEARIEGEEWESNNVMYHLTDKAKEELKALNGK